MATRKPVVSVSGKLRQLPAGDKISGGGFSSGDVVISLNPTAHSAPDWLKCDGSFHTTANTPASLRPLLVEATDPSTYSASGTIESPGTALTTVFDINESFALVRRGNAPFLHLLKKTAVGYSWELQTWGAGAAPTAAVRCATMNDDASEIYFSLTAAGSSAFRKLIGSNISSSGISTAFSSHTIYGCGYGRDGYYYFASNVSPYVFRTNKLGSNGTLQEVLGGAASTTGLRMSPNRKYMVTWHTAAPYICVWEFDGVTYQPIGSPITGASNFTRVEISDTGVIVGKPASGSNFYFSSVLGGMVGPMVTFSVSAATAWGLTPDGRYLLDWVSNVANYRPLSRGSAGSPTALPVYSSATAGTLYDRPGLTPGGLLLWGASGSAASYALAMASLQTGYMAPNIENGFLKA